MDTNSDSQGESLCTSCGLCCQGVFHDSAISYNVDDVRIARDLGAQLIASDHSTFDRFKLPCPAWNEVCTVFPYRPSVCIDHRCLLLGRVTHGDIELKTAMQTVAEMKLMVEDLLGAIQEVAGKSEEKNPENFVHRVMSSLGEAEGRNTFKRSNLGLLKKLGAFKLLKEQQFYPSGNSLESNQI